MQLFKRLVRSPKKKTIFRKRQSRTRPVSAPHSSGAGGGTRHDNGVASRESTQRNSFTPSLGPSSHNESSVAARLPEKVLACIFSFVCPHSLDESYESAEKSTTELGCMLCDMRELARMSLVCTRWNKAAQCLQYKSIRLDSVHYCGLEEELQARRKRGSFFQKQLSPLEIPEHRMRLLYRTFQDNEVVANLVQFLKMPYMTRETCKQDLARLVSLLPNLRYVDLPDGVYQDDPSCASLKAILYTRCPELQKMTWVSGSEKNFVDLWVEPPWLKLEVVELSEMKVENPDLVRVLSSMPYLKNLKVKAMPWTSDAIFDSTSTDVGLFPALQTFEIEDISQVTIDGLCAYLSRPAVASSLQTLAITNSENVPAHLLHRVLALATSLTALTIREQVSRTIPRTDVPLFSSQSLRSLSYEITDNTLTKNLAKPSPSYYAYLSESLWDAGLPKLKTLRVRETTFHNRLQNDKAKKAGGAFNTAVGWAQELDVYSKGPDHMEWARYRVSEARGGNVVVKPVSERTTMQNRADVGGRMYLAVPADDDLSKKEKRRSRQDLWR